MAALNENSGPELQIISIVFLFTAWFSVLLRCYVRIWITKSFQMEDALMVVAAVRPFIRCITMTNTDRLLVLRWDF